MGKFARWQLSSIKTVSRLTLVSVTVTSVESVGRTVAELISSVARSAGSGSVNQLQPESVATEADSRQRASCEQICARILLTRIRILSGAVVAAVY